MSDSSVNRWFPMDIGWFLKASNSWDPEWGGPVMWVLCEMWPEGARIPNEDAALARTARVSLAKWKKIKQGVGKFFTIEGDFLIQDTLVVKYQEALVKYGARIEKASKGGIAKREKERSKHASGSAPSTTSSIARGSAPAVLGGTIRAIKGGIDLDLKEEDQGSIASAVPNFPDPSEIQAIIGDYPKFRYLDHGPENVHLGESASDEIAEFMTKHPDYPLRFVVRWYGKSTRRPRDLTNFLSNPPARESWKNAWDTWRGSLVGKLRTTVDEILSHAQPRRHAHA